MKYASHGSRKGRKSRSNTGNTKLTPQSGGLASTYTVPVMRKPSGQGNLRTGLKTGGQVSGVSGAAPGGSKRRR